MQRKLVVWLLLKSDIRFGVSASMSIRKIRTIPIDIENLEKSTQNIPSTIHIYLKSTFATATIWWFCMPFWNWSWFLFKCFEWNEWNEMKYNMSISIGIVCAYFLAQHAAFSCMNSIEHKMVWKVIFKSSCYVLKFNWLILLQLLMLLLLWLLLCCGRYLNNVVLPMLDSTIHSNTGEYAIPV